MPWRDNIMNATDTKAVTLLTTLLNDLRRNVGMTAIDLSFESSMQRIVCESASLKGCTVSIHAVPPAEKNMRIKAFGQERRTPICFDTLEFHLPYGTRCELGVSDLCKPDWARNDWIQTGETRWVDVDPIPEAQKKELDIANREPGTAWNYRGTLLLWHNDRLWTEFKL